MIDSSKTNVHGARPKTTFVGFRIFALGALLATTSVGICADSADAQPRRPARPTTKPAPKGTSAKAVASASGSSSAASGPASAPTTTPPLTSSSAKAVGKVGPEPGKPHTDDKGGVTETRSADGTSKVLKFGQVEIEGRLKSPQIVYFLRRVRAEFSAGDLGHRSFLGELKETRNEPEL